MELLRTKLKERDAEWTKEVERKNDELFQKSEGINNLTFYFFKISDIIYVRNKERKKQKCR